MSGMSGQGGAPMPNGLLGGGAGASAPPPSGPDPSSSPHAEPLEAMHSQAKAQFEAVDKVVRLADVVRKGIDSLVSKGPAVSVDDVLDEMAVLVSKGADPKALSAMMAGGNGTPPMPEGGEALQAWVAQQDQMVSQKEQVLKEQQAATRHEAAVGALHMLAHDHIVRKGAMGQAALAPEGPSAPESSNPLTRGPSDA